MQGIWKLSLRTVVMTWAIKPVCIMLLCLFIYCFRTICRSLASRSTQRVMQVMQPQLRCSSWLRCTPPLPTSVTHHRANWFTQTVNYIFFFRLIKFYDALAVISLYSVENKMSAVGRNRFSCCLGDTTVRWWTPLSVDIRFHPQYVQQLILLFIQMKQEAATLNPPKNNQLSTPDQGRMQQRNPRKYRINDLGLGWLVGWWVG